MLIYYEIRYKIIIYFNAHVVDKTSQKKFTPATCGSRATSGAPLTDNIYYNTIYYNY